VRLPRGGCGGSNWTLSTGASILSSVDQRSWRLGQLDSMRLARIRGISALLPVLAVGPALRQLTVHHAPEGLLVPSEAADDRSTLPRAPALRSLIGAAQKPQIRLLLSPPDE